MKFQTRGAASWLRKTLKELVHGWTSVASSMSGSSLFQGARQVPYSFWLHRAVHTGWWSGEALSCWVRMVAEARTGTREKAVVRPVSLPSSRTETWGKLPGSPARLCARFLALVSWCPGCVGGPGVWPSGPVLCVGRVPSCAPGLVALSGFVLRVCFKKRRRPRAPKGRVFRPWWSGMRGNDPRTVPLTGTPFYAWAPYVWYGMTVVLDVGCWVPSLVCSNPPVGAGGRTSSCRAGSPWRLFVFLIFFSWCSRSSSQVVLWDYSCCRR